jgi:hypothetical protein
VPVHYGHPKVADDGVRREWAAFSMPSHPSRALDSEALQMEHGGERVPGLVGVVDHQDARPGLHGEAALPPGTPNVRKGGASRTVSSRFVNFFHSVTERRTAPARQVENELSYPDEPRTLWLHLHCVGLWEAVRLTAASIRRSSRSSRRSAGSTFRPALPIPIDWDDGGGP